MIDKIATEWYLNKHVSLLINGKFFKGIITSISDNYLVLKFNDEFQVWSYSIIDSIQEVER